MRLGSLADLVVVQVLQRALLLRGVHPFGARAGQPARLGELLNIGVVVNLIRYLKRWHDERPAGRVHEGDQGTCPRRRGDCADRTQRLLSDARPHDAGVPVRPVSRAHPTPPNRGAPPARLAVPARLLPPGRQAPPTRLSPPAWVALPARLPPPARPTSPAPHDLRRRGWRDEEPRRDRGRRDHRREQQRSDPGPRGRMAKAHAAGDREHLRPPR